MDPLSIVSSVIAVSQAGERVDSLISCIQTLLNARRELTALVNEISNIRAALSGLNSRILNSQEAFASSRCIHQILETCLVHVEALERLVANSLTTRDGTPLGSDGRTARGTKRIAWLRKQRRIEKIKQELKVGLSAIHLELLSLNL
jgi:hypothetical protein